MKIKLFEEYNDLDFTKYNLMSSDKYDNLVSDLDWILLSEYELKKIEKIVNLTKRIFNHDIFYILKLSNINPFITNIELIKLPDDYYSIDFYYKNIRYYIKCDQLQELLSLLKYMNNNED